MFFVVGLVYREAYLILPRFPFLPLICLSECKSSVSHAYKRRHPHHHFPGRQNHQIKSTLLFTLILPMSLNPAVPSNTPLSARVTEPALDLVSEVNKVVLNIDGTKERIKKMFDNIELSVSSYDTAWVAMVPSLNSPKAPCFPQCVKWIAENQLSDGSWGLPHRHPFLMKDTLSSTLACILALKRWDISEEQINKGLRFIELNSTSVTDVNQHAPIGFDIIFPGMIKYAKEMNLYLPLESTDIDVMLHRRDLELRRGYGKNLEGREAYLSYVSEGIGKLQDWEMVMKYQRKNGSLFNSPSTTAAAASHLQDASCLHYLHLVLEKFGNAVPTIYPLSIYARLRMVDTLGRLGIKRHFKKEIELVLDETYR